MDELEEAAEVAREIISESGHEDGHGGHGGDVPNWIGLLALSTLVMALLSAIGALMAGITAQTGRALRVVCGR